MDLDPVADLCVELDPARPACRLDSCSKSWTTLVW